MVQSNKVLTVSYGTFSCTLEGFEDSFETMKAIAEYFRDLAADDRYFGAEPPQPDAEMLARIAEREIARQVEARRDEGGIVLRAAQTATVAAPSTPVEAPVESPVESPAEAAVETPAAEPVAPEEPSEEPGIAQEATPAPEADEAPEAGDMRPEPEDIVATGAAAEEIVAEDVGQPQPESPPAADSIAAKLARIRAVVSRNEAEEESDYSEDEHAEAVTTEAAGDIMHILQEEDELASSLEATHAATGDEAAEDQEESVGDLTWESFATDETGTVAPQVTEDDEITGEEDAGDEDILSTHPAAGEDSLFGDLGDEEDDEAAEEDDLANILGQEDEEPGREPEPLARVLKIKKTDFEAAVAAGQFEEIEDEDEEAAASAQSALSAEDEADLMRELAEVEADVQANRETGGDTETGPARAPLGEDDADVDRLMDAAGEKLSAPEAAARHEAYSHMRAAVATTQAERDAGGTMGTHTSDDPYRVDLAHAVRPRRPGTAQTRPLRPTGESRPAPLKLVAEQRVDDGAKGAAAGPVRPRRIATRLLDEEQVTDGGPQEGGFADFAREMGATELPELLEAAAAYMSFVEGRDQFSRPQLMNKVRQANAVGFNREDGLRSFGQLLREGKIEKKGGGRFAVSGEIGFRPDEREAG